VDSSPASYLLLLFLWGDSQTRFGFTDMERDGLWGRYLDGGGVGGKG